MKMRTLLLFVAITSVWLPGFAQIRYEQWMDGNRANAQWGNLIFGEQTLTVDVASMPYPGLHFLNILPYDESGEPGVWKCIAFLMPEYWLGTNNATQMEYWVAGYDKESTRMPYTGGELSFNIDISRLSYGLHFFNFRTINEEGEAGSWKQVLFYISNGLFDPEGINYEYWIDEQDAIISTGYYPGILPLEIDVDGLDPGIHTFNFRGQNWIGAYGETFSVQFEIEEPDDIEDINAESDAESVIYDLQGRRIERVIRKGIYIINGKKMMMK